MGVVIKRYIYFLILLIPTPLVSVLFCSSIPTFCSLTLGAHARSEGYCSCPVCMCVHSYLPPHTLELQNRDTNEFVAIQGSF